MEKTNNLVSIFLLLLVSITLKSQPVAPTGRHWTVVSELTDEFNGTSLDRQKWLNYQPYWAGREPSQFDTNNVSVSDGNLILRSRVTNHDKQGNWIASACVSSKTKTMKPGYYSEARVKCPDLSMTGAYWFQGNYSEIDVVENFGAATAPKYSNYSTYMNSTLHYFKDGWSWDKAEQWNGNILPTSCADSFYTYGVWWKDSTTVIFYLNGKEVHTSKTGGPFDENMYMFFDMEAFDWGIGMPTIASLDDNSKNKQFVDWVHTYKLEKNNDKSVPESGLIKSVKNSK
jgi:hypothetical protein